MYTRTKNLSDFQAIRSKVRKMAVKAPDIDSTDPKEIIKQTLIHDRSMGFLNLTANMSDILDEPYNGENMLEWNYGELEFTFLKPLIRAYNNLETLSGYEYYDEIAKAIARCETFHEEARDVVALRKSIVKQDPRFFVDQKGIKETIALMEEADKLNTVFMDHWQSTPGKVFACEETMAEFHACGNNACLAGHIRLSGYFRTILDFTSSPSPVVRLNGTETTPPVTVAALLDVPLWFANVLIFNQPVPGETHNIHALYAAPWRDIRASHILPILNKLLAREAVETLFPKFD